MRHSDVLDLADCSKFRLAIMARPPRAVRFSLLLMLGLLLAAVVWAGVSTMDVVIRAPAVVRSADRPQDVRVAVDGEVAEAFYREGDPVSAGEQLIRLETDKLEERRERLQRERRPATEDLQRLLMVREALAAENDQSAARAVTGIEIAKLELQRAERERTQSESELAMARAAVKVAERELARNRALFEQGILSRAELDAWEDRRRNEQARERSASEAWKTAGLEVELAEKRVLEAHQAKESEAQSSRARIQRQEILIEATRTHLASLGHELKLLELDIEQCAIEAPIGGVIISEVPRPGAFLVSGDLVTRIAPAGMVVEAMVPNSRIAGLRVGQPVRIKLDAYDYQKYGVMNGQVAYMSPDALLIERPGIEPRSVYRVLVELHPDSLEDPRRPMELGMTGTAEIVTDHDRILALAIRRILHSTGA
jgi:HlyD family secretion protein